MSHLVLHAGHHKAGSSAIQDYLFNHFSHPDFRCLHWGRANSSMVMLQAFKQDLSRQPQFRDQPVSAERLRQIRNDAQQRLRDAMEKQTASTDIISAEGVAKLSGVELQDLQHFLSRYYQKITVYQYVRPLKSRMESVFQERLKHGAVRLEELSAQNVRRAARIMDEAFGAENVRLHKYDRADFPGGDIAAHFAGLLGVEFLPQEEPEINSGLSLAATQLLYIYRTYHPKKHASDELRIQRLTELAGPAFRLHSQLFNQQRRWPPTNAAWFEQRAGFSISEDICAHDDVGITAEADLLNVPAHTVDWLNTTLSEENRQHCTLSKDPQDLAEGVRALA